MSENKVNDKTSRHNSYILMRSSEELNKCPPPKNPDRTEKKNKKNPHI